MDGLMPGRSTTGHISTGLRTGLLHRSGQVGPRSVRTDVKAKSAFYQTSVEWSGTNCCKYTTTSLTATWCTPAMQSCVLVQIELCDDGYGGGGSSHFTYLVPDLHPFAQLLLHGGSRERLNAPAAHPVDMWQKFAAGYRDMGAWIQLEFDGWQRTATLCTTMYGKACEGHAVLYRLVKLWLMGECLLGRRGLPELPSPSPITYAAYVPPVALSGAVALEFADYDSDDIFVVHDKYSVRQHQQESSVPHRPSLEDLVLSCTEQEVEAMLAAVSRHRAMYVSRMVACNSKKT